MRHDSPENIQRCLNCTLPVECCQGNFSTCRAVRKPKPQPRRRNNRLDWTPDMVLDVVEGRKTQRELARELGVSQYAVHAAIGRMREEGKL